MLVTRPCWQTTLVCIHLRQFRRAMPGGDVPGCLTPVRCIRCLGSLRVKQEMIWFLRCNLPQQAKPKGRLHLKHCPCQRAIQSLKPNRGLNFLISLEEKASATTLLCTTSYPGNGKAEFSVFLRLTGFEFMPPRSTGGCVNCHL